MCTQGRPLKSDTVDFSRLMAVLRQGGMGQLSFDFAGMLSARLQGENEVV